MPGRRAVGRRVLVAAATCALVAGVAVVVVRLTRPSTPTFASETAFLRTPPPHPRDAVRVSSAAAFARAVEHAHAGETIVVGSRVRVEGEFTGFDRVVPGGTVNVVFEPGAAFTGGAGKGLPAVFVRNAGGWRIWGGTITNPAGGGILVYATSGPFTWTGFGVSRTGGTCVAVLPVGGDIERVRLEGRAGTARPDLALDPHAEKGTGIHAWNIADATGGIVRDSVFAADVADQATGAAVEVDTGRIGGGVTIYARARRLGFPVRGTTWDGGARSQVAGNVIQLWGGTPHGSLDLAYVAGGEIQGRLVDTTGIARGASLARVTVGTTRVLGPILQNHEVTGAAIAAVDGLRVEGPPPSRPG